MPFPSFYGSGQLWLSDDANDTTRHLKQARQLGLNAVRVGVVGDFLPESQTQSLLASAREMLVLCRDPTVGDGLRVLFGLRTSRPRDFLDTTIYAAGRIWGEWLADLYDNPPDDRELAELVIGFSLQNECSRHVNEAGVTAYQEVLEAGGTIEEAFAAGEAAAAEEATEQVKVIANFCRGVRDGYPPGSPPYGNGSYPPIWRVTGGLSNHYTGQPYNCIPYVTPHFFPDEGGAGPALNAFGIHWYRQENDFTYQAMPPAATPKDSFSDYATSALNLGGIPTSTPVFVQEQNVNQNTFDWTPGDGQDTNFAKAKLALLAQMAMIAGDSRVQYLGPFSPWIPEWLQVGVQRRYAIQIAYEDLPPGGWILTPTGAAVREYAGVPS